MRGLTIAVVFPVALAACDRGDVLGTDDLGQGAAAPVAPVEPVAPAPVEEKPPPLIMLSVDQLPARDRGDAAFRRSLDPGDCPDGNRVLGRAPPAGLEQYCGRADGTRFGPARQWPKDALPSSGGYIPGQNFRPIAAANYHEGQLHGPRIIWWPSGLRRSMENYNVGVPMGIWVRWDEEGTIVEQRNYFDSTAPLPREIQKQAGPDTWVFGTTHLHTGYFDNGQMSRQAIRLDDTHQLVAGSRTWFENGQMKCRSDQVEGRMAGYVTSTCWYDNGTKKEEGSLRAGKRHGEWSEWTRSGSLKVHGTYFEGKKTGTWERYVGKKKKVQTYDVPVEQVLEPLPKMWTRVFKEAKTVVVRPDCNGVSPSITLSGDNLIVAAGGDSTSHPIETVNHEGESWVLGLGGRQSIRVLYKGEGTAALWRKPTPKLAAAAGIYVPTAMVNKLEVQAAKDCGATEAK